MDTYGGDALPTYEAKHNLDSSLIYHPSTNTLLRLDGQTHLPSQPWVSLNSQDELINHLHKAHLVSSIQTLQHFLTIPCRKAKTSPACSLAPLHVLTAIHDYIIATTTHPDLHLTYTKGWHNKLYIQPMPQYLLSNAFWTWLLAVKSDPESNQSTAAELYSSASGFMRTYTALIRSEVDFKIATSDAVALIPAKTSDGRIITFEDFVAYMQSLHFDKLQDDQVAERFKYGLLHIREQQKIEELYTYGRVVPEPPIVALMMLCQLCLVIGWIVSQFYIYKGIARENHLGGFARAIASISILLGGLIICSLVKRVARNRVRKGVVEVGTELALATKNSPADTTIDLEKGNHGVKASETQQA